MRFIYKITIGLLIFNSMLLLFAGFFSTSLPTGENAINITGNATYESYKITGDIFSWGLPSLDSPGGITLLGFSIGILAIGLLVSWALKNLVPIGAAFFADFLAALYIIPASVIYTLDPTNNWIISTIISLFAIIIGILAAFSIIEMFTGQRGAG